MCRVCDNRVVRAYEAEARPGLGWSVACSLWVQEDLGVWVEVFDVEVGSGEIVVVNCDRDISYCSVGGIVWTDALCEGQSAVLSDGWGGGILGAPLVDIV